MVQADCPNKITVDNFGVQSSNSSSCSVYHVKELKTFKEKVFFNKDSAKTFYEEAINHNKSQPIWGSFSVNNYKIDSVKFKIIK